MATREGTYRSFWTFSATRWSSLIAMGPSQFKSACSSTRSQERRGYQRGKLTGCLLIFSHRWILVSKSSKWSRRQARYKTYKMCLRSVWVLARGPRALRLVRKTWKREMMCSLTCKSESLIMELAFRLKVRKSCSLTSVDSQKTRVGTKPAQDWVFQSVSRLLSRWEVAYQSKVSLELGPLLSLIWKRSVRSRSKS